MNLAATLCGSVRAPRARPRPDRRAPRPWCYVGRPPPLEDRGPIGVPFASGRRCAGGKHRYLFARAFEGGLRRFDASAALSAEGEFSGVSETAGRAQSREPLHSARRTPWRGDSRRCTAGRSRAHLRHLRLRLRLEHDSNSAARIPRPRGLRVRTTAWRQRP